MDLERLQLETDGPVARVWLNRPDARNAFDGLMVTELRRTLFHLFSVGQLMILADAMYPPFYVSPDWHASSILRELRRRKRHMAIVRSPEGAFLGIVTLEDILEEIVGEIEDEHDTPRPPRPPRAPA